MNDAIADLIPTGRREAWAWWESRRLRYNIGLAVAGWCAWSLFWIVQFLFDAHIPTGWQFLQTTVMLGVGFLVVMVFANVLFFLGVAAEILIKPADVEAFRKHFWRLGYGGSIALPFLLPLVAFVVLLAADRSY